MMNCKEVLQHIRKTLCLPHAFEAMMDTALAAKQHQGEPVALPDRLPVRMPERRNLPKGVPEGWNACLDEIAKLGPLYTRPAQGDPVAYLTNRGRYLYFPSPNIAAMPGDKPLYTHADPAEVEQLRSDLDECDGDRWKLRTDRDTLRTRLAERDEDLELAKKSCRTWEAVAKKQKDRLFDVLRAILNGSKLSYHPWPFDQAEFEPIEASNPVYLVGGKDGAIAIRPYIEPERASAEPSAPVERESLHDRLLELHAAVTARRELSAKIRRAGTPPHTDFWHQSIDEAESRISAALSAIELKTEK